MAYVHEYTCGCIIHELAGTIRKCSGVPSRSLSGKQVKSDNDSRHSSAIESQPKQVWEVANILP
jgi:hypothetical protein